MTGQRILHCILLALCFASVASAEDTMKIYVDINAVTTSDDLQPVDGMTAAGQPNERQFELLAEAGLQGGHRHARGE